MHEENILSDYIKAEKDSSKLKKEVSAEHNEILNEARIKIKAKHSWLFLVPLFVHVLVFQIVGGQSSLIDKLWLDHSAYHIVEDFDHFYWIGGVVFILTSIFYVTKTEESLLDVEDNQFSKNRGFDDDTVALFILIPFFILIITSLFGLINLPSSQENAMKINFVVLLLSTALPFCVTMYSKKMHCKKDLEARIRNNKESINEWNAVNTNKNRLKEMVTSDSSAMKTVLREYEKSSFEYHPEKKFFVSLVERMIEKNEEEVEKHGKMKELKGVYENLYNDKLEIQSPVVIEND